MRPFYSIGGFDQPSAEPTPLDALIRDEQRQLVRNEITRLDSRERAAVTTFFDFPGGAANMPSLAQKLGCSRQRAYQLYQHAVQILRLSLDPEVPHDAND